MVNEESELYKAHPEWALRIPGKDHSTGRNQMFLDLTREEVQEYIINCMKELFSSAEISYVKWDMNRNFTDVYSAALPADRQGEICHRFPSFWAIVLPSLLLRNKLKIMFPRDYFCHLIEIIL